MELVLGFWRVKTLPCYWDNFPVQLKIDRYIEKANAALTQMRSECERLQIADPKLVFLAPEHLFRAGTDRMAMPEASMKRITAAVKQLSQRFPEALIIPGTLVWLDEALPISQLFKRKHVARNSAFIYAGGKLLFRYDKQSDAGELFEAEKQVAKFVSGDRLGVFTWNQKRFGIEICLDHSRAVLRDNLEQRGKAAVDVHLIIGSSVANKESKIAARFGGLVVHTDGGDTKPSHAPPPLPNQQGPRTGVWKLKELAIGKGDIPATEENKRNVPNAFRDLKRRNSVTVRPEDLAGIGFEGFQPDISIYHQTI